MSLRQSLFRRKKGTQIQSSANLLFIFPYELLCPVMDYHKNKEAYNSQLYIHGDGLIRKKKTFYQQGTIEQHIHSSTKQLLIHKSSCDVADKENISLENSHLQLDNHSLFHQHSLRFHVYGLCIGNVANYPSHKRKKIRNETRETKQKKKKKQTCVPV